MITHFLKNHIILITEEQVAMLPHIVMVIFCQTSKDHQYYNPHYPHNMVEITVDEISDILVIWLVQHDLWESL